MRNTKNNFRISRSDYEDNLRKHGYRIAGPFAYLDTPYGTWVQRITTETSGYSLKTVTMENQKPA